MADTVTLRIRVSPEDLAKIESQIKKAAAGGTTGGAPLDVPVKVPDAPASKGGFDGMAGGAMKAMVAFGAATAAVSVFGTAFQSAMAKQDTMADLSALTGVTGAALDDLGARAEKLSNTFGTSLVANVDSMKGVLSRLGPDIAKDSAALGMMTEDINILAKASGLDATASMDALTTSLLQFGVDLSNPATAAATMTEYMNVMAAGAQQGAAEIPQVSEAIKQAGVAAYGANISFVETNAALQVLAAGGKVGSEAGVALRNVLGLLQKPSTEAVKALKAIGLSSDELAQSLTTKGIEPTLQMLGEAMNKLGTPAEKNTMLMTLFGVESASAAQIMIRASQSVDGGTSAFASLSEKLTGTNTAVEQARVKGETLSEQWARTRERMTNMAASMAGMLMPALSGVVGGFQAMVPVLTVVGQMVVPGIVAWGAYTLAVNASAIATSLASNAFIKMGVAMLTNPFFITAAAIAASVVYLKALSSELEVSATKTLENTQAELELNKSRQASNIEDQKRIESTQKLMDKYEALGAKTNRTKAEDEQLTKAMIGINDEYPGLIRSGDSFEQNLGRIKTQSEKLKGELGALREEMAKMSKDEKVLKMASMADEADVALEGLQKVFESADSNAWDKLGVGNAASNFKEQFGGVIQAMNNAVTDKEFSDARMALGDAINNTGFSAKDRVELRKNAEAWVAARKTYIESTQAGATEAKTAKPPGTTTPPPGGGGGGGADAAKKKRDEALRYAMEQLKGEEEIALLIAQKTGKSEMDVLKIKEGFLQRTLGLQKEYSASATDISKTEWDIKRNQTEQAYTVTKSFADGSLGYLEAQLSKIQQTINETDPNSSMFGVLVRQSNELEGKIQTVKDKLEGLKNSLYIDVEIGGQTSTVAMPKIEAPDSTLESGLADQLANDEDLQKLEKMKQDFESLGGSIGSAFDTAFSSAIEGGDAGEAMKKLFRQLIAITFEYIMVEAVLQGVLGTLKEVGKTGLLGLITGAVITGAIMGLVGAAKKAITGFATGGVIVGENGPEIIAPAREFSEFAGAIVANSLSIMKVALARLDSAERATTSTRQELDVRVLPGETRVGHDVLYAGVNAEVSRRQKAVLGGA